MLEKQVAIFKRQRRIRTKRVVRGNRGRSLFISRDIYTRKFYHIDSVGLRIHRRDRMQMPRNARAELYHYFLVPAVVVSFFRIRK